MRLSASSSLTERRDCIVVASVSCIYGLGSPDDYANMCIHLKVGDHAERNDILKGLIDIQYNRNDTSPSLGEFRVRGDSIDVFEPQREEFVRISFWGDEVESIDRFNAVSGKLKNHADKVTLFPCKHFVLPKSRIDEASAKIMQEMRERVDFFEKNGKLVEAQRLSQRVRYDLEMMQEIGYCSGIENYSMHLAGRSAGTRPYTLFDFFPEGFLTIIDESHVTLPQLNAMYKADRNRKTTLIDHGFRLPSALENRPMKFDEIEDSFGKVIFVSATPGDFEREHSSEIIPQIIRPTGLLDPEITVRPLANQVDESIEFIRAAVEKNERTIVTTLTKKGAEQLSDYLSELNIKVSYIHSELDALARVQVLSKLKTGDFDCVIGINLLREGIDLPEVAQVLILDADKEGFLRSARSLIQVAFKNNIDIKSTPRAVYSIFFSVDLDFLTVNDDGVISVINGVCGSGAQLAAETALSGVILEKVSEHLGAGEVVDSNYFVAFSTEHLAECETTDTTETVNSNFYRHFEFPPTIYILLLG